MNQPDLKELPFLRSLCWQGEMPSISGLSEVEILHIYERNWRYRGATAELSETERQFVQKLAQHYQSWLINDV
ncbi:MAG: hypothetical protein MUC48_23655 [Leptolyngbya sp. Prado105]|jgi:hypothetical protein|nr:hypothetical protein [Leptolyngbya sp. Prado105]